VTDRRTDGRAIAYSAPSIYAICCRALTTGQMAAEALSDNNTVYYSHNSALMFTFTLLQQVLSECLPDSYSLVKPVTVPVTGVLH